VRAYLADAVADGGGEIVDLSEANILVWADPLAPEGLEVLLHGDAKRVEWVQLPYAGVEPFSSVITAERNRIWTCAKGVYAEPVAEHALTLLLAGLRGLGTYAHASSWSAPRGTNLVATPKGRARVVILGGGGITTSLLRLLEPFGAEVIVVRKHPIGPGEVGLDQLDDALTDAVGVVLALALTPETVGIIGRPQLERMRSDGWIVNVARGRHIVTDDLVGALQDGVIGGAALDVTDPEPLPEGHPLWTLAAEAGNCIITPHVGNTPEMAVPLLAARTTENLRRWLRDEPLIGLVDPDLGY
jgi:phosphoglycerate dehydrogenase-like enzyme